MMSLQQARDILQAEMSGIDVEFESVCIDTRQMKSGDLFVAIKGENFDGHDYINTAKVGGAVAVVVDKTIETELPYLKVTDTRLALGQLAAAWREKFPGKVVGVTGSNGKTTVKEMIAAILEKQGSVVATRGNFNNDIGLPLTLFRMKDEKFAVIEMGANHAGEISYLTKLTQPDVAIITNAGPAHLDGFGSLDGVARAKGEIYQGLTEDGVAVINMDDKYSDYWQSVCKTYEMITFSMQDKNATVYGQLESSGEKKQLMVTINHQAYSDERLKVMLKVPGVHNVMNALAAISAAVACLVSGEKIMQALNEFKSVKGRLDVHQVNDVLTVIDDTYNANPASLSAGIEVLTELPGEHWLVLGDMGELGEDEIRLHFDAGIKARTNGVTCLLATGNASKHAVDAFGTNAKHFENKNDLIDYIERNQPSKLGVLIKGSRFMHMEQVVAALTRGDS